MMGVIQHYTGNLSKPGFPVPVMRIFHGRGSFDKTVVYVTTITEQADVVPHLVSSRGQITH